MSFVVVQVALEILGWSKKEVSDLITSRMWYAQPADHTWAAKRCRNVKFTPVHAVLLTLGQVSKASSTCHTSVTMPSDMLVLMLDVGPEILGRLSHVGVHAK